MTYSIVGRDEKTGELGVAVQSRAFGVGICAWARPGIGAVATQSFTEKSYGPKGLDLLAAGRPPADALAELVEADDGGTSARSPSSPPTAARRRTREPRASPTAAIPRATASRRRETCSPRPQVWDAAADAFESADGTLAERLLDALDAAEAAGGDFRGREAAALVVVSGDAEEEPWTRVFDLRVDNHADPLGELRRLHRWQRRTGGTTTSTSAPIRSDEAELGRAAGLPDDQLAVQAAIVAVKRGDLDAAVAALRPCGGRDPPGHETFSGTCASASPPEVLDRLDFR